MLDVCHRRGVDTHACDYPGARTPYGVGRRAARGNAVIWASLSEFLDMGGYGFYVWGSYLVAFICIAGEIILVFNRKRTLLRHLSLIHQSTKQEKGNETTS
ncbi:MAG: heme exporter protein CcmD [Nitrosospira sp.]